MKHLKSSGFRRRIMLLNTEKSFLAQGTEWYAHKGEYLFRKWQPAEYVFYLKDGSVDILDDETQTLQHVQGCRCFLGLHEALLDAHHQASVKVRDESILLVFEKQQIDEFLQKNELARRYFMLKICDQMALLKKNFE
ncbi:MAG: cyclic nucleotide-binding domain-containing protein [Siphonobacter sp.]